MGRRDNGKLKNARRFASIDDAIEYADSVPGAEKQLSWAVARRLANRIPPTELEKWFMAELDAAYAANNRERYEYLRAVECPPRLRYTAVLGLNPFKRYGYMCGGI